MQSQKQRPFEWILTSTLLLISTCFTLHSQTAQPRDSPTEIVIIGTVHKETTAYRASDLVAILTRVRPDIILCEYDSSFFTKDFRYVRNFGGLEQTAVLSYAKDHQVLLRPYDVEGRNEFYRANNSFERENALVKSIHDLAMNNKLDPESQKVLEQIQQCMSERDRFLAAPPRVINSFECDRILAQKIYVMDFGYSEIIHRNLELSEFRDFWNSYSLFESSRNSAMTHNIERWAKEFRGKRIAVLSGFEHRHNIRLGLRINAKASASLKEYWDYPDSASKGTIGNATN